jgi:uncharacterized protein (TIGR00369 family)
MDQSETMQERVKGFFPDLLGITFVETTPDRVVAEMAVRDELCTVPGILHGGAMMAFADTLGAVATVLNIPTNARTTTLESKTNFFAAGRAGTTITAETLPLHRGKRAMVWQTSIRSAEGKLLAQVTQTQFVDIPS